MFAVVLNKIDPKAKKTTRFPALTTAIAQPAWDKYMSRFDPEDKGNQWGDEPENVLIDVDGDEEQLGEGSSSPRPAKRRRMSSVAATTSSIRWPRPSPNHPIYGQNGIMRGILAGRGKEGKMGYMIDPYFNRPSFRSFGHNGCTVGDWWPMQKAANRDGAHGAAMGGIARAGPDGAATSIAISGGYKDLDEDQGDRILYSGSGPGSEENITDVPIITHSTQAMQTTHALDQPLRVFRSARAEGRFAPMVGLRYEGLYKISQVLISRNLVGGAYMRFELRRMEGQPPINRSRPTSAEMRDFERIQDYY